MAIIVGLMWYLFRDLRLWRFRASIREGFFRADAFDASKKLGETGPRVLIVDGDRDPAEGKRVSVDGRVLSCVQPSGENLCFVIICHRLHR